MKKVLALVLTSALAVSVAAVGASASSSSQAGNSNQQLGWTTGNGAKPTPGYSNGFINPGVGAGVTGTENGVWMLADTEVYINKDTTFSSRISLGKGAGNLQYTSATGYVVKLDDARFSGTSNGETVTWQVEYTDKNGAHSGIPKGVNGVELLKVRISFDRGNNAYVVNMNTVDNPTVEIFQNVTINVRIATWASKVANPNNGSLAREQNAAKAAGNGWVDDQLVFDVNPFASDYSKNTASGTSSNAVARNRNGFDLLNQRYYSKDVYKDAKGVYRINASTEYPVVDESAFDKAYGNKLIVSYPDYNVIFPDVKSQDIALNLEAKLTKAPTVKLDSTTPILKATFHDIFVKDSVQIEFIIGADAQNYKGTNLWAYMLNSEGKPIKGTEAKVVITESNTLVTEVKAGSRLAAYGEGVSSSTIGIYGERQDATATDDTGKKGTGSGSGSGSNPKTGASDVINVATAFAAVSLAAAGFVATKKASK